ncbi:MAG: hypothetical protein R3F62_05685 [Planctomycetota bacterium]
MSDQRIRELERRWRETGELEAEIAWLRARLHGGSLPLRRAEVAAGLGSEAARAALGAGGAHDDVVDTLHALIDLSPPAAARAAVAVACAIARQFGPDEPALEELVGSLSTAESSGAAPPGAAEIHTRLDAAIVGNHRARRRQERAVRALAAASVALSGPRRTLRVCVAEVAKHALDTLGALTTRATIRPVVEPLLLGLEELENPSAPAELLLTVKDRFAIVGRGVVLLPQVNLGGPSFMDFTVELRPPGGAPPTRCRTAVQIPLHSPYDPDLPPHALLVHCERVDVPVGTEVWEVGP